MGTCCCRASLTVAAIRTGYYGQPPPGTYGAPLPTSYLGPPASTYGGAPPGSYGAPPPATMYGGAPMSGYAGGVGGGGGGGGVSFDPYGSSAGGWGQPPASGAIAFDPSSYRPTDEPIPFDPSSYAGPYPSSGGGWSQPQPPPSQAPTSYYGGASYQQQPQPPPTQMVTSFLVLGFSCPCPASLTPHLCRSPRLSTADPPPRREGLPRTNSRRRLLRPTLSSPWRRPHRYMVRQPFKSLHPSHSHSPRSKRYAPQPVVAR